jgi:hypothetical protein
VKGKYGKDDRIILFTSTDKNDKFIKREPITIFKMGLLANQFAYNELQIKDGYKKKLMKKGKPLFFEEAMKEAIEMAKNDVNWAENHNWELVKKWALRWQINVEKIEPELRRTFQKGLDEYTGIITCNQKK